MRTLINWGGKNDFNCAEFILNHEVVNHLKIGEDIYLEDFVCFIELTGVSDFENSTGDWFDTFSGATNRKSQDEYLSDLKNAIYDIGNGASKVEHITYFYKGIGKPEFVKVIYLSGD